MVSEESKSGVHFVVAFYQQNFGIDDQAVAVLHEHVARKAELCFLAFALSSESGIRIGNAPVSLIRALLTFEVDVRIRTARTGRLGIILVTGIDRLNTFERGPSLK